MLRAVQMNIKNDSDEHFEKRYLHKFRDEKNIIKKKFRFLYLN